MQEQGTLQALVVCEPLSRNTNQKHSQWRAYFPAAQLIFLPKEETQSYLLHDFLFLSILQASSALEPCVAQLRECKENGK